MTCRVNTSPVVKVSITRALKAPPWVISRPSGRLRGLSAAVNQPAVTTSTGNNGRYSSACSPSVRKTVQDRTPSLPGTVSVLTRVSGRDLFCTSPVKFPVTMLSWGNGVAVGVTVGGRVMVAVSVGLGAAVGDGGNWPVRLASDWNVIRPLSPSMEGSCMSVARIRVNGVCVPRNRGV